MQQRLGSLALRCELCAHVGHWHSLLGAPTWVVLVHALTLPVQAHDPATRPMMACCRFYWTTQALDCLIAEAKEAGVATSRLKQVRAMCGVFATAQMGELLYRTCAARQGWS